MQYQRKDTLIYNINTFYDLLIRLLTASLLKLTVDR